MSYIAYKVLFRSVSVTVYVHNYARGPRC